MTGPEGNSEMILFPKTNSRETKFTISQGTSHLSDLLYSKTKQKQILKNALRFLRQHYCYSQRASRMNARRRKVPIFR